MSSQKYKFITKEQSVYKHYNTLSNHDTNSPTYNKDNYKNNLHSM